MAQENSSQKCKERIDSWIYQNLRPTPSQV